jgi:hypothetical protein
MDARARLLAVEVLLADPEALGNDALETDLYILRDQLRNQGTVLENAVRLLRRSSFSFAECFPVLCPPLAPPLA